MLQTLPDAPTARRRLPIELFLGESADISVEPFHMFRYLDEQVFRFNKRGLAHDGERFELALSQIAGKRLTFAEVTGKVGAAEGN